MNPQKIIMRIMQMNQLYLMLFYKLTYIADSIRNGFIMVATIICLYTHEDLHQIIRI